MGKEEIARRAYYLAIADKLKELGYDTSDRLRITGEIQQEATSLINLFEED